MLIHHPDQVITAGMAKLSQIHRNIKCCGVIGFAMRHAKNQDLRHLILSRHISLITGMRQHRPAAVKQLKIRGVTEIHRKVGLRVCVTLAGGHFKPTDAFGHIAFSTKTNAKRIAKGRCGFYAARTCRAHVVFKRFGRVAANTTAFKIKIGKNTGC